MSLPLPIPSWIIRDFPAEQMALLSYLKEHIDNSMLREISLADYGQDSESHYKALREVFQEVRPTSMDTWYPMEVLELTRWSESKTNHEHLIRAYCCATLLVTPNCEPSKETLIQLVESSHALGTEAQHQLCNYLTWSIGQLKTEEDRPFFALALTATLQSLYTNMTEEQEFSLAEWLLSEEEAERSYLMSYDSDYESAPLFIGLSFNDQLNEKWKHLIQHIKSKSNGTLCCFIEDPRLYSPSYLKETGFA